MLFLFRSCHVCGMWIEIRRHRRINSTGRRHATYVACGLKFVGVVVILVHIIVMPRMWHVD